MKEATYIYLYSCNVICRSKPIPRVCLLSGCLYGWWCYYRAKEAYIEWRDTKTDEGCTLYIPVLVAFTGYLAAGDGLLYRTSFDVILISKCTYIHIYYKYHYIYLYLYRSVHTQCSIHIYNYTHMGGYRYT